MTRKFEREIKYLVLKWDDIDKYLSPQAKNSLLAICQEIDDKRLEEGKTPNSYVVVNEDEPYAETVWQLIKEEWEAQDEPRRTD